MKVLVTVARRVGDSGASRAASTVVAKVGQMALGQAVRSAESSAALWAARTVDLAVAVTAAYLVARTDERKDLMKAARSVAD